MSSLRRTLLFLVACAWLGLFLPFFGTPCHAGEAGLVIEAVAPNSPAAQAGLRVGDHLLSYDGKPLASPETLLALQQNTFGKQEVALRVRRGSETLALNVPIGRLGVFTRPEMPAAALRLFQEGGTARQAGEVAAAIAAYTTAAQAAEAAGDAAASAFLWGGAGAAHQAQRHWQEAQAAYEAGLALLQESGDAAARSRTLAALGRCSQNRNDWAAARDWYERALRADAAAGYEHWAANDLNDLGVVAASRGDLTTAQDCFARALAIRERLTPNSLDAAESLHNLGNIARARGDLAAAQAYHTRALPILEWLRPDALDLATSLINLGNIAYDRGDLAAAQQHYTRALAIQERLETDSLNVAQSLTNLGVVARARGDLAAAQRYHSRALAIREQKAPGSLDLAVSLTNLGVVARARGDLAGAQAFYQRALAIQEWLAPDSLDLATSLHNLGLLDLRRRRPQEAHARFVRAVGIIEAQRRQISSPEARSLLVAQHSTPYAALLHVCLYLHDLPAAFATMERARARSLVELIAERAIDFSASASRELLDHQRALDDRRGAAYRQLSKLDPSKNAAQIEPLRAEITQVAVEQRELTADIRRASPRYAALQYPQPLNLKQAQAALDPGTLLLAYAVDDDPTYLFAVTRTGLKLYRLPIRSSALREQVQQFQLALARRGIFRPMARSLYASLLQPAQAQIDQAQRILLCPDGPLHTLSFAALSVPLRSRGARERYLAEVKPLHTIVSLSVYAGLRHPDRVEQMASGRAATVRERSPVTPRPHSRAPLPHGRGSAGRVLALGDPTYPAGAGTPAPAVRAFATRGVALTRLPHTRAEVTAIGRLFPRQTTVRVGAAAVKRAVEREGAGARILHFACHGLIDNQDPLASALALSPEGEQDDGLLRAYEVMEKVRLKADLVVLSACETGLGEETRHEGIVGLTRAFQYAGAKSVLVSLWSIADASTARLMGEFYRHLKAGVTKDEALRRAQVALLRSKSYTHPFYWAPFVLVGDWRR